VHSFHLLPTSPLHSTIRISSRSSRAGVERTSHFPSAMSYYSPEEQEELGDSSPKTNKKKTKVVVVIGGGWAGFSAADALSTSRCIAGDYSTKSGNSNDDDDPVIQIELLDASPRGPGGLAGGWRTPVLQRPVEAGLHGFWREYKNTFATIERIGLTLDEVLTPYTASILVSQSGRVALAPVLGAGEGGESSTNKPEKGNNSLPGLADFTNPSSSSSSSSIMSKIADFLPPPLDVALLSEFNADNPLTIADRISALGLLGIWADFQQEDAASWARYDKISADNLFRSVAGVSNKLYSELISPLLHVLPMTPGYDCSAAAALSCFHVFALQVRGAFDVRWCRGTISERIFNPWASQLQARGNVNIRGLAKVTAITEMQTETGTTKFTVSVNGKEEESIECDAVVLAVGGTAIKRLLPFCPPLAELPGADGWKKFRGVTCVAVRLFFRPSIGSDGKAGLAPSIANAMKDSPVVVCGPNIGNIPQLAETGFCIYDLQRLQDEFKSIEEDKSDKPPPCVALEVDFFRANDLSDMQDNMEVAKLALRAVSAALDIEPIDPDLLLDVSVVRAKDAVSHFCVDSASWSPSVKLGNGLYICGDWVDRTGHASWSTEKSVVTARQASAALAKDFGMTCDAEIIPAASDTPQLSALRKAAKIFRTLDPSDTIPPAPWVLARQLSGGRI
jgi:uncharacterized protein with NAD-binding domain and iron-sulfur cluster